MIFDQPASIIWLVQGKKNVILGIDEPYLLKSPV